MRTIKTCLTTVAALLCSITVSAATYSDWTSTNKGQNSSTSSNTYTIAANAGDVLTFDWLVSSESNYDWLAVTLNGSEIIKKSGEASNSYQYTFTSSGTYTMVVKYTKDGSVNGGSDYAKVYNIVLDTGGTGGDSDTENIVASGTCGDNLTWRLHDDGTLTIEGIGQMTSSPWSDDYKSCIKTIIVGEGVTSIEFSAFFGCSNLTSVTIPNSVTSIEGDAFDGCSSLTSITIPNSVTSIGDYAFRGCSSLTSITIPNSVTSIGDYAFSDCSSLTSITIPEGVTSIGYYAFSGCSNLTSITIPESVTSIEGNAFANCSSLTSITLPEGLTSIEGGVFSGCSSLTSITIPESVTSIEGNAFANCSSLTSITLPESVTSIEPQAFSDCSSLTSITIPKGVTSISNHAFFNCSSLTSIVVEEGNEYFDSRNNCNAIIETATNKLVIGCSSTVIPNTVAILGVAAFIDCFNLTSVVIPGNVGLLETAVFIGCRSLSMIYIQGCPTIVPQVTFGGCCNLKSITCESLTPPPFLDLETDASPFEGVPLDDCVLYVPSEAIAAYKKAEYWKDFTNIQPIVKRDVEILDNVECFEHEIDEECASITYTRNFKNTNWQALYVPFEIPVTEEFLADFEVADLNDVRQYDRNDDGVKDETVIEAFKVTTGTLEANYPYLIRAREVGEKVITVTDATLYATEENSIDCSSIREKFTFAGTYSRLSSEALPQGEGFYALSGGIWKPVAENASLGAFRFYLKVDSRGSVNDAQGNAIRMRIIGENGEEDGATGIDNAEFKNQNSELIFDFQGRRVDNPTKGVYIVNGVKRVF